MTFFEKQQETRAKRNKALCDMVRNGETIENTFSEFSNSFPPRPRIRKNDKDVERLYGIKLKTLIIGGKKDLDR